MRDNDFDEQWNRLIDRLQWCGHMLLVPVWFAIETVELAWQWLYDLVTGSINRDAHRLDLDEEPSAAQHPLDADVPGNPAEVAGAGLESARPVFDVSLLEPVRFLSALAGILPTWLITREWLGILIWSIPTGMLLVTTGLVLQSSWMDRAKLSQEYIKMGLRQLPGDDGIIEVPSDTTPQTDSAQLGARDLAAIAQDASGQSKSNLAYAQLLFRRALMLHPQQQSLLVIGTALIQSGSVRDGRNLLRKISPDHAKGLVRGHAVLATSYLVEYSASGNQQLLAVFEHHANIAARLPATPVRVLMLASDLHWQAGRHELAIELLELASKRSPTASLRLAARASQLGDQRLLLTARKTALANLLQRLQVEPLNVALRIEVAQLLGGTPEELAQAEKLLLQGLELGESPRLSRALSEVIRVQFVRQLLASNLKIVDLGLLDRSIKADPTNPLVGDVILDLVTKSYKDSSQLQAEFYRILATGEATLATHAVLAELHLSQQRSQEAVTHLEQVYALVPSAIKYTWLLARSYAEQHRLEEAEKVATTTLEIIESRELINERYAGDLLETLASIYELTQRRAKAVAALNRLLVAQPKRVSARQMLARLYSYMGEQAQAQEQQLEIDRIQQEAKQATAS
ncbi:MAG: hypothetical protein KF752_01075 [Pirellulaceae bacterium]|nr:hypothetical protein [Pirellulaceae bacterium]